MSGDLGRLKAALLRTGMQVGQQKSRRRFLEMGTAKNISEGYKYLPAFPPLLALTLCALVHSHNEFAQKS